MSNPPSSAWWVRQAERPPSFQPTADKLLARFTGATSARIRGFLPWVIPTLSIGSDRVDQERVTFFSAFQNVQGLTLIAIAPTEIRAGWAARQGGALDLSLTLRPASAGELVLTGPPFGQTGIGPVPAQVLNSVTTGARHFSAPAGVTLQLPVEGLLLEAGFVIEWGPDTVGPQIDAGVLFRGAGPL